MIAFISPVLLEPSKATRTEASKGLVFIIPYERVQSFVISKRSLKGAVLTYVANPQPAGLSGPTVRLLGREPSV